MQAREKLKQRLSRLVGAVVMAVCAAPAFAQLSGPGHLDVLLQSVGGPGGSITIGTAFNGEVAYYVPGASQLTDFASGYNLYPGRFGEFPGGQGTLVTGSDDPGFQAFAGTFGSRESFYYRALGALQVWTPAAAAWHSPTGGEGVVLFGKLPARLGQCVLLNPPASLNCSFYKAGTHFRAEGITGPVDELLIGRTGTNGAFHDHLDWFLEDTSGAPPVAGAYLVQLQVFSDAIAGGGAKYEPSDPFYVVFNHGLNEADFVSAVNSRVAPVPEPSTLAMLLAGLLTVACLRRRRIEPRA